MYGERSFLLNGTVAYCGDILEVDHASGLAMFQTWTQEFVPELFEQGLSWLYCSYNPDAVWKVLDESAVWQETDFRISDAIATPCEDGWRQLRSADAMELSANYELQPEQTIVRGGWDHEHCFICNDHIDEDQPLCFRSAYGKGTFWWACPSCYRKWVITQDIGFLVADHNQK